MRFGIALLFLALSVLCAAAGMRSYWLYEGFAHVRQERPYFDLTSDEGWLTLRVSERPPMTRGTFWVRRPQRSNVAIHQAGFFDAATGITWWGLTYFEGSLIALPAPNRFSHSFSVPYWLVASLAAAWPLIHFVRRWRAIRARDSGTICGVCGYDLRASPHRCPECGTVLPQPPHNE